MAVDSAVPLIGKMGLDVLIPLIESLIGSFELLSAGLDQLILAGVYEVGVKEKFPEMVHLDVAGKTGLRISGVNNDVDELPVAT